MATAAVQHTPIEASLPINVARKHNVTAQFNYHKVPDDGSLPPPIVIGKTESFRPPDARDMVVQDISGEEDKYTLDSHGFQIYKHASQEKDFVDDEQVKAKYWPETEQLLKDATGAGRVLIFDHTIRREPKDKTDLTVKAQIRGPVRFVHVDQSYTSSGWRITQLLPDEAEELLKKRFQIINVWRPIKTIYKDPLGVVDSHSVPEDDLVVQELIFPDRKGETYTVKPNPNHRWYFKYGQRPDEVTLIKCYDSLTDGRARRVPHSAFTDPDEEDKPSRESIEVRALVFYDD